MHFVYCVVAKNFVNVLFFFLFAGESSPAIACPLLISSSTASVGLGQSTVSALSFLSLLELSLSRAPAIPKRFISLAETALFFYFFSPCQCVWERERVSREVKTEALLFVACVYMLVSQTVLWNLIAIRTTALNSNSKVLGNRFPLYLSTCVEIHKASISRIFFFFRLTREKKWLIVQISAYVARIILDVLVGNKLFDEFYHFFF